MCVIASSDSRMSRRTTSLGTPARAGGFENAVALMHARSRAHGVIRDRHRNGPAPGLAE
jgi:hypothetical protein